MIDFGIICDSGLQNLYYLTEEMSTIPQSAYPCSLSHKQLLANDCEAIYSKMLPFIIQTHFFESVNRKAQRPETNDALGIIRKAFKLMF